jgi:hypothetical protein
MFKNMTNIYIYKRGMYIYIYIYTLNVYALQFSATQGHLQATH